MQIYTYNTNNNVINNLGKFPISLTNYGIGLQLIEGYLFLMRIV